MELKISGLCKTYKNGVKALDNINLNISTGMFGLLGPNGAGKSTMMRTIATLQEPDEGEIHLDDLNIFKDPTSLRKVLGYLPQEFGVYPNISAWELLQYFANLKGISSKKERNKMVNYLFEITNLVDARKKSVSSFSGGMKQRFGIAQMLLNNPKLIIVDEPTAGLDPAERRRFLNVLREIGSDHIVIFSTHIVEDVEELCNDMAIMNEGKILLRTSPSEAAGRIKGKIWQKVVARDDIETESSQYNVLSTSYNPDNTLNLKVYSDDLPGNGFEPKSPQLEEVYFTALNGFHVQN